MIAVSLDYHLLNLYTYSVQCDKNISYILISDIMSFHNIYFFHFKYLFSNKYFTCPIFIFKLITNNFMSSKVRVFICDCIFVHATKFTNEVFDLESSNNISSVY